MISGIHVVQHQDYSFIWHMQRYAEEKLSLIETTRGFLSNTKELDDKYMNKVISANGQIGWLGSNGRPECAAAPSIIAGEYKNKSPHLIIWCNQTIKQYKATQVKHCIWPIKVGDLRFVVFTDSSFDPRVRDINKERLSGTQSSF